MPENVSPLPTQRRCRRRRASGDEPARAEVLRSVTVGAPTHRSSDHSLGRVVREPDALDQRPKRPGGAKGFTAPTPRRVPKTLSYQCDFAKTYFIRGEARGESKAVLAVLDARGRPATEARREWLLACADLEHLESWVRRAVALKATAELFAPPKRATITDFALFHAQPEACAHVRLTARAGAAAFGRVAPGPPSAGQHAPGRAFCEQCLPRLLTR